MVADVRRPPSRRIPNIGAHPLTRVLEAWAAQRRAVGASVEINVPQLVDGHLSLAALAQAAAVCDRDGAEQPMRAAEYVIGHARRHRRGPRAEVKARSRQTDALPRGAMEGAVTCRWLVDPNAAQLERLSRGAALQLKDLQTLAQLCGIRRFGSVRRFEGAR